MTGKSKGNQDMPAMSALKILENSASLGITAAKADNLGEWYQQVLTKGEMISYYDVSGCYILKPGSWSIWKKIEAFLTKRFEAMGVEDCNFPLFISQDNLQREKDHIEGFAAEVAWVTHGGSSKLDKPIAIRPTSETAMYGFFANEIRSHRDLPLRLNQWVNVVRWEFKDPMPFLRSREFHWQEGHTAHISEGEAASQVLQVLDHYADMYEYLLAVPVVKGKKTVNEQFPGAHYTTTIEGFIPATGRGIQAATSHHLGQHFSEMFNIKVEDPSVDEAGQKNLPIHVWQTSWGCTTRSIGVMILTHGDNKGLVLPPRAAKVQVVIIPVGIRAKTTDEDKKKLYERIDDLTKSLQEVQVRVQVDLREGYSPGWKFSDWEVKGVPLRLEVGPRDLVDSVVTTARRDTGVKGRIAFSEFQQEVPALLEAIQKNLFDTANENYRAHRKIITHWDDFVPALNDKNLCLSPHCLRELCEDEIKKLSARRLEVDKITEDAKAPSMGAKSLCIPFDQPDGLVKGETRCINPGCGELAQEWVMFGRSY
ncbi:putative proline--tRNA ligase [Lachnellula occidentalis]|uniref:proline--tRNA ligase n=1 Tax=Lachnellula occidentalis TaxID=215460 RepID=A0A8H8RDM3_9HELO|nr:putative proline--tRNA ligase [Lachnellula occidentalis]